MVLAGDVVRSSPLPDHEARRLLATATGRSSTELIANPVLTPDELDRYRHLELRRLSGEPLQYLEGTVPFGPATIGVDVWASGPQTDVPSVSESNISTTTS